MHRLICPTFALLVLLGLTGCERAKTQFDREVDRLCAIDGGVHVYEKVVLPKDNFNENGRIASKISHDISFNEKSPYRSYIERQQIAEKSQINLIRTGLSLSRSRLYVVRVADGKILGERIRYIRGGGDLFGPWEGSNYSCPRLPVDPVDVIFIKGN